jgi:hypothetical protein
VGVEWQLSPDWKNHSIYLMPEQTNPAHLDALHRYMDERTSRPDAGVEFSITPDYDHRPAEIEAAVYQSAFLLMFSYFGYEFAFRPCYQPLREQVLRPEENIWKTRIVLPSEEDARSMLRQQRQAVVFLREPPGILAVLRLRRPLDRRRRRPEGLERVFAVVLPGPDGSPPEVRRGETFSGSIIPHQPEALVSTRFHLLRTWNTVQRSKKPSGPRVDPQGQGAAPPPLRDP